MIWQSSALDQHSTHWPTCSSLCFSSASSLASSSCCARAFASWFPRQVGDSKVCILMRLTNRHMIKPWVYAIPSEKNANMKAPASSSSTCFSAFSAAVCCWSFCTFLLNDSQYFLGTFFTITLLRVFNSWCPNQNVKHTSKVWLCASRTCCWSISFSWRRIGWLCWRSAFCSKDAKQPHSHLHPGCSQVLSKLYPSYVYVARKALVKKSVTWTDKVQCSISIRHTDPPAVPCSSLQSGAFLLQAGVLEPLPHDFQDKLAIPWCACTSYSPAQQAM